MGISKVTLSDSDYIVRPTLAEAKLITEKQGRDEVYVVTLREELRKIESMIASMENRLQLNSAVVSQSFCPESEDSNTAKWFHAKSGELNVRLRRIEQARLPASTKRR